MADEYPIEFRDLDGFDRLPAVKPPLKLRFDPID